MADYYTQTVVQPTIPDADMTPLERLVLSRIFESEEDGNRLYFFAGKCASEVVVATRAELEEALSSRPDPNSTAHRCVTEQLAEAQADTTEIELDFTGTSWEPFFQDIVRRSRTLRYVTVVSAFTCSKMRPDGFGGMATIITRDAVLGKSTNDIIEDFFAQTGLDREPEAETLEPVPKQCRSARMPIKPATWSEQ
jgi:hypothetical protein